MSKILIFGISGFVGPYLAQEFIDAGYIVYGTDLIMSKELQSEVIFEKSNISDEQEVYKLIYEKRPDLIINLAGISSVGKSWNIPQTTILVNVIGALNILEAVRKQSLKTKILFIGSSEEYTSKLGPIDEKTQLNANNPYGISKITQGNLISLYRDQYDMKVYEVRSFNHTGIGQNENFVLPSFCKQIAQIEKSGTNGVIKVGNLDIKRDFSHVKDVVRAYRMIIENEDCKIVYNVGSGKTYALSEILSFLKGLTTQTIRVEIDADRFRAKDTPIIQADYSLIKNNLGWIPQYTVWDALKEMYIFFLNED